jgi:hypothetical protein
MRSHSRVSVAQALGSVFLKRSTKASRGFSPYIIAHSRSAASDWAPLGSSLSTLTICSGSTRTPVHLSSQTNQPAASILQVPRSINRHADVSSRKTRGRKDRRVSSFGIRFDALRDSALSSLGTARVRCEHGTSRDARPSCWRDRRRHSDSGRSGAATKTPCNVRLTLTGQLLLLSFGQ